MTRWNWTMKMKMNYYWMLMLLLEMLSRRIHHCPRYRLVRSFRLPSVVTSVHGF
jgi:hypothetical protein